MRYIPPRLGDLVYDLVAKNRDRLFRSPRCLSNTHPRGTRPLPRLIPGLIQIDPDCEVVDLRFAQVRVLGTT